MSARQVMAEQLLDQFDAWLVEREAAADDDDQRRSDAVAAELLPEFALVVARMVGRTES